MEESYYSIGEIAKLFQISPSKIRYWEEKEVFCPRRDVENDYRLFNLQSSIELLDVIFYRNLNVPIQKMKHFNRLSPTAIYAILEDTEEDVRNELIELEEKLEGIARRKEQLESLFSLKERGYQEEVIPMRKIVSSDMSDAEGIQIQLEYLTNFVLYKEKVQDIEFKIGLSVPIDYQWQKEVLWQKDDHEEARYITCLMETDSEYFNESNIKEHEDALEKQGYEVKRVLASYLATASDEHENSVDYYKVWLEVEQRS
ncbi:MerR family transcriptional regulator [Vagococcus sp.]|uniref:MerR family transcriptional regulator n=1 Tax=Vagococcus sp. TaxID=1933889 RepID=UPI002FC5EA92